MSDAAFFTDHVLDFERAKSGRTLRSPKRGRQFYVISCSRLGVQRRPAALLTVGIEELSLRSNKKADAVV
jgi:hypothetical protein